MVFMRAGSSLGPGALRSMMSRWRGSAFGLPALGLTACGFFWAGAAKPVSRVQAFCAPPEFLDAKLIGGFLCGLAVAALSGCLFRWRRSKVAKQVRSAADFRIATQDQLARQFQDDLIQGVQGLIVTLQLAAQNNPAARSAIKDALNRAEAFLIQSRDRLKALQGEGAVDPTK